MVKENLGKSRFLTLTIMAIAIAGVSYVVGSQDTAPPGPVTATIAPAGRQAAASAAPAAARAGEGVEAQALPVEPTLIDPTFRAVAADPTAKPTPETPGTENDLAAPAAGREAKPIVVARLTDGPAALSAIAATADTPSAAARPDPRQSTTADPAPAEPNPAD